MKAAFLTAAEQFEVRELAPLQAPSDGLVLEVKTCGVCGSDLRRWKEGIPAGGSPMIPGHEAAGVVKSVGTNAHSYKIGDRLAIAPDVHCGHCWYCRHGLYNLCDDLHLIGITPGYSGGFADEMILTGEMLTNGIIHAIPAGLSFAHASLAEPCSSVLAAHTKLDTSLGDTVVVMGAGPIGCLHLVIAHSRGARVVLSEPNGIRRDMARIFNPEFIFDPSQEDVVQKVKDQTEGRGADIVICANPVAVTQTQAVELVRKGGKIALFGGLPKANPMTNLDGNRIHYGEIVVTGTFSYHPTFHEMALDVLAQGKLPADQLITNTFSLNEIQKAFENASNGKSLKVMVSLQA